MAHHGLELLRVAQEHGCDLFFEASVGGGIPLIGPFRQDLAANEITEIHAIINGTTNYILTRMTEDGASFDQALEEATEKVTPSRTRQTTSMATTPPTSSPSWPASRSAACPARSGL